MAETPTLAFPELAAQGCYQRVSDHSDQAQPTRHASMGAVHYLAGGVTVVTAVDEEGERYGAATASACPLAADPPTLVICVYRNSALGRQLLRTKHYCVNILSRAQREIAEAFSDAGGADGFRYGRWGSGANGAPILGGAIAAFECTIDLLYAYPVHLLVIGRVDSCAHAEGREGPLVYFSHRFGQVETETDPLPADSAPAPAPDTELVADTFHRSPRTSPHP